MISPLASVFSYYQFPCKLSIWTALMVDYLRPWQFIKSEGLSTVYFMGTKQTHTPQSKPYHIGCTKKRPGNEKIPLWKRSYSGIK